MRKKIYVNKMIIIDNDFYDKDAQPVQVDCDNGTTFNCHRLKILGPSEFIYKKMAMNEVGPRVWIETRSKLILYNDSTKEESYIS